MPAAAAGRRSATGGDTTWSWSSKLPWPATRGARLWSQLATDRGLAQYDVELCEPSAGHIALVLVKKQAAAAPGTPGPVASAGNVSPSKGRRGSTPLALTALASTSPRVVYVVDAIPPRPHTHTATSSHSSKTPLPLMPRASTHPTRSPVSSPSTISNSSNASFATSDSDRSLSSQLQDVDELDLIDELFATSKASKDGSVLAKAPMLCARFDCKVVAIQFTRSSNGRRSSSSSTSTTTATNSVTQSPLRCVVAREDGVVFVWEWGADLHQWTFLNQFCCLANPNLKWTKPVAAFTATSSSSSSSPSASSTETIELAWWSLETRDEPKLWLRKLAFEHHDSSLYRTELTVGHAFTIARTDDVVALHRSKLGLWVVTTTLGVQLRCATSLQTIALAWPTLLHEEQDDDDKEPVDVAATLLVCVHNVTGELLVVVRATGAVFLVTPQSQTQTSLQTGNHRLWSKRLPTLAQWTEEDLAATAVRVAAHRHVLLLTTTDDALHAFSSVTGDALATLALPTTNSRRRSFHTTLATDSPQQQLWTIAGAASAVGLWTRTGFWFLRVPSAKALSARLATDPRAAFATLVPYGKSLAFETAQQALGVLEQACASLVSATTTTTTHHDASRSAWDTAWRAISSPALLLALIGDQNVSEALVDELARVVTVLFEIAHDVSETGRFPLALVDKSGNVSDTSAVQRLTPANVEALHHLSNWVLLAKRKTARLHTSAHRTRHRQQQQQQPNRHEPKRPRAVSALTTVVDAQQQQLPLPPTAATTSTAMRLLETNDDDPDAHNFRLSRKLRPMSSLRFASGSCSVLHGRQWLAQLEAFLLDGVAFKEPADQSTTQGVPSHLLFHDERRLDDYQSAVASFSRHMYVESMGRLYLLHEPTTLLAFVACVATFCPRPFALAGATRVTRTHAERALTLLPPIDVVVQLYKQAQTQDDDDDDDVCTNARATLLAYTSLLCRCGYYVEASSALLQCDLLEHCRDELLLVTLGDKASCEETADADADNKDNKQAARSAVYFALLEYCVQHRSVSDLEQLLRLKPADVSALHVLRALRTHLVETKATTTNDRTVTVGQLRPVLLALLKQ